MADSFPDQISANAGFQQNETYPSGQMNFTNTGTNGSGTGNKKDEDARKLFIGGLPAIASKEDVQNYFSRYGEVEMCTIKTDVYSGRSRGFGFLIFKDVSAVEAVLDKQITHEIHGKHVDPKLATPQENKTEEQNPKIFVGGLDKQFKKDDISAAFSNRGKVVDVYLPVDTTTNESKGYAFVTFEDATIAAALCTEGTFVINGKSCDVRKAQNKNTDRSGGGRGGRGSFGGGNFGGGRGGGFRGGRGGGRGGRGGYDGNNYGNYNYGTDNSGYNSYGGSNFGGGAYGSGYNNYGSGYDQNNYSGGYDQNMGYGTGNYGGSTGGFDQNWGGNQSGYQQDQGGYKMKRGGGRGGGYQPY